MVRIFIRDPQHLAKRDRPGKSDVVFEHLADEHGTNSTTVTLTSSELFELFVKIGERLKIREWKRK